jgi:His-Xaa-Ser system protein HxsD
MQEQSIEAEPAQKPVASFRISHDLVSVEALLKTCYWFSRDFVCVVEKDGPDSSLVSIKLKGNHPISMEQAQEEFLASAMDFALRELVTARTLEVRDVLLAKAFSESGVLEEVPQGVFGDRIEEEKHDGMFKILSNG